MTFNNSKILQQTLYI